MKLQSTMYRLMVVVFLVVLIPISNASVHQTNNTHTVTLFRWADQPKIEAKAMQEAESRLQTAIKNPEYMLKHWIELPTAPKSKTKSTLFLSLREAILLALRYNPNIRNAELDRIIQRYQLRLQENEFELQFALAGSTLIQNTRYQDIGNTLTKSTIASPELGLNTKLGGKVALKMDNNVQTTGTYNPILNLSLSQPLLRGFGRAVNEAGLLNAKDNEWLNQVNLQQTIADQITDVIARYRALILSGNNLENEKHQLFEAQNSYKINEKKIAAGQLEPTGNIQQSYQVESLKLMVEQAENDFLIAAQDLLQSIGLDPDLKLAVPSNVILKEIVIPDTDAAIDYALAHNAQYLAMKMAIRADERAYKVAKNSQLWQLDVNANLQNGTTNDIDTNSSTTTFGIFNGRTLIETAGVTLTIPIRDISRRSELVTAKVRLEKDRLAFIAAKRALITNIKNTINNIKSQARRYELAERQVKLAEKSYMLEKKKQEAGIASSLDVNNTQNQLLQAQNALISAKIAYLNQISALQRILGTTLSHWRIQLRYDGV